METGRSFWRTELYWWWGNRCNLIWPPTHFDISLWRVGALTLIPPFLFAVPTTSFNIFLLFLHLCSWCFATYLPWRDVVRLKSLMIIKCFGNWKDCLGANSNAPRNCSMYNTMQRHVVRIPHVAMDQPGLPLTSGWIRVTVLQAHLMLLDLCVLLLQHYFDTLCVHLLDYFKPFCNQRKAKCLLQAISEDGVNLIEDEKLIYWIKMLKMLE